MIAIIYTRRARSLKVMSTGERLKLATADARILQQLPGNFTAEPPEYSREWDCSIGDDFYKLLRCQRSRTWPIYMAYIRIKRSMNLF